MALTDSQKDAVIEFSSGRVPITLAEGCKKGDALGYSSGWKRALATASSVIQLRCVAMQDGKTGEVIEAAFGPVIMSGRFSGGTLDGLVYVDEGTAYGKYTESAPSTGSDANTIVGRILAATRVLITPNYRPDTTA